MIWCTTMTLYDIYLEYRSGNKTAFNRIFSDNLNYLCTIYQQSVFRINIAGLDGLIINLYTAYCKAGKRIKDTKYPKFHDSAYNGSLEDMRKDIIMLLLQIFNDGDFIAHSEGELYGELKYRAVKFVNESIGTSVAINDNKKAQMLYEGYYIDNSDSWGNDRASSISKSYTGGIKEIYDIMSRYDIRDFMPANAKVQKNVIGLIEKFYKPIYDEVSDELKYPSEADMTELYRMEYGETIECSQYSRALSSIFRTLCECTTAFKGEKEREKFIKKRPVEVSE